MDAEQVDKIRAFLAEALARTEARQCIRIDLVSGDGVTRDPVPIRAWASDELGAGADWFARTILDAAKRVAAEAGSGKHRFVVRAQQIGGARPVLSFPIYFHKEEQEAPMEDPYRTGHPPEVKISGLIADNLLRHLEKLLSDEKLDNETRRKALAECYHTLRVAIWTAQGKTTGSVVETVMKETAKRLEEASKETDKLSGAFEAMYKEAGALKETLIAHVARRNERVTQMATTIAAGLWARNDPALDLGDANSKTIVAKLARATAELILQQEEVVGGR